MTPAEFDFISGFLKERSGLVLTKDKLYLLESRLTPVMRRWQIESLQELVSALRKGQTELAHEVTDAMTTNETFFFRDTKPFDTFRQLVLPFLLESRKSSKSIRIWCAAASTGQEPYSLAMVLLEEKAKLAGWTYEIIGTDLSATALTRAEAGKYSQFEVQRGLPTPYLLKYFEKAESMWQINAEVRSIVQFKENNLLKSIRSLGKFDVVFCRNVLIYFDQEDKADTLDRIGQQMPDDGVLFLGGSETVVGLCDRFAPIAGYRGVYQLAGNDVSKTFHALNTSVAA